MFFNVCLIDHLAGYCLHLYLIVFLSEVMYVLNAPVQVPTWLRYVAASHMQLSHP